MKGSLFQRALLCAVYFLLPFGVNAWSQTFTLTASPKQLVIFPGEQNIPITVTAASSTYSGPINVTVTGLPSGVSVSPLSLSPGGSGTVYLNASRSADKEDFNPKAITATSKFRTVEVTGAVGAVTATAPVSFAVSLSNTAYAPPPGNINLPIITINTGGVPIVNKTTNVPGTITITSANGSKSYLPNSSDTDNTATFHLHGNTTIEFAKKPYHIKLNTSVDLLTTMGLSCPYLNSKSKPVCDKTKSYVLLANYDDKTFLRDWSASALANAIPMGGDYLTSPPGSPTPSGTSTLMPWAPHSLYAELFLNGVYEGNYQLIEEVKVDTNKVNITELSESDINDDVTGGYLMEIDTRQDEAYVWTTPQKVDIGLIDPDFTPAPEVPEQTSYISSYVDTAEDALFSSTYTNPTTGWRAYYDEAALVNFYLVNELMGNVDGGHFSSSDYLYKAIDNPLIYMGPVWDFDVSSGNVNFQPIVDPTRNWMNVEAVWYKRLLTDPTFKAHLAAQFNALKSNGVFNSWIASIRSESSTLEQSQANNFGRWPSQEIAIFPNAQVSGSYNGEVNYLVQWLQLRIAWLDSQLNTKTPTSVSFTAPTGTLRSGAAVPLIGHVTANSPTGAISFFYFNSCCTGDVLLGSSNVDSSGNATVTPTNLPAGTYTLEAVYSGDATNAISTSKTQSITVLSPLISTVTNLATASSTALAGTAVTFSVSVLGNSGTGTATGMVSLRSNGKLITSTSLVSGVASLSPSNLPLGNNSVQITYSGDTTYSGSLSNLVDVTVSKATPTITLSSAVTTTTAVSPTFFNVAFTGITAPLSGQIVFHVDGEPTTYRTVVKATTINYPLHVPAGMHQITAEYYGNGNYNPVTSNPVTVTSNANKAQPAVTLSIPTNPVAPDAPNAMDVSVSEAVTGVVPTGIVKFMHGPALIGEVHLDSNGQATFTRAAPDSLPSEIITAVYSGDDNYLSGKSNTVNLVISK